MFKEFNKIFFLLNLEKPSIYFFLIILIILSAVSEVIGIGLLIPFLSLLIDPSSIIDNNLINQVSNIFKISSSNKSLTLLIGCGLIFIFLVKNIFVIFSSWVLSIIVYKERTRIAKKLLNYYLSIPYTSFLKKDLSTLIHTSTGLTANFSTVYLIAIITIISEFLIIIFLLSLLIIVNLELTFIVISAFLIIGCSYIYITRKKMLTLGNFQNKVSIEFHKCLIDIYKSLKEIKVNNVSDYFLKKFNDISRDYINVSTKIQIFDKLPKAFIELILISSIIFPILILTHYDVELKNLLPTIIVFGMTFLRLLPSYNRIFSSYTSLRLNQIAVDVLFKELNEISTEKLSKNILSNKNNHIFFQKNIKLKNIYYKYPDRKEWIINNLSINFSKGKTIALVGKSGSGKSTIINILLGLLKPSKGYIEIDNNTKVDFNPEDWGSRLGFIPQNIFLMNASLKENIAFGINPKKIDNKLINEAIKFSQLQETVKQLPKGLDTNLGDDAIKISGGQKQRVAIARAVYQNPDILIMDEATSNLDKETEGYLQNAIKKFHNKKTIIIIAHKLNTIKDCDIIYVIDKGQVKYSGDFKELSKLNILKKVLN